MLFWKTSVWTVETFPRRRSEKKYIVLLIFNNKSKKKKIFSLSSSRFAVWKCNLARKQLSKNNNPQAIRKTGANSSFAKILKFVAADFAEDSIHPEQGCRRPAKFFYKCRFLTRSQHPKHINSFLFLPRLWQGEEKTIRCTGINNGLRRWLVWEAEKS